MEDQEKYNAANEKAYKPLEPQVETTWQDRLVIEKKELASKIMKLDKFINESDSFKKLSKKDEKILNAQLEAMISYHGILNVRINNLNSPID